MASRPAESSRNPVTAIVRWLPALLPPLLIFLWMRDYLVDVPFMDDYVWLPLWQKIHGGTFTWHDFFFVQMEHRLTLPAVLAWLFYHIKAGCVVLLNWTSFAQVCLTGWNLHFLLGRTMPDLRPRWLVAAVVSLALFSPVQASTLLWADCFSSYMAPFFLTLVLVVFHSRLGIAWKLPLCLISAVMGTNSLACGILIWPLVIPVIIWSGFIESRRDRMIFLGVWITACVVTLSLYFTNLVNQAAPVFSYEQDKEVTMGKHLAAFLENPLQSARFILMFGGSMLGRGTFSTLPVSAFVAGSVLAAALIAACVPLFFSRDKVSLRTQTLPWIMIGSYSFGMGAMVAVGRIYASLKDMTGPLWNRYTCHSIMAVAGVIVLGFFWWRRLAAREENTSRRTVANVGPVLLGAFVMLLLAGWIYGQSYMQAWWSSRLRDATAQFFTRALPHGTVQVPLQKKTLEMAVDMDNIGLLKPAMARSALLSQFPQRTKVSEGSAKLESVVANGSGTFLAEGVAYVVGQSRTADGVLLCYKDAKDGWTIFAVGHGMALPLQLRDTLAADLQYLHFPAYPSVRRSFGSFSIEFNAGQLPAGEVEVAAFAFDFLQQRVYPMAGTWRVDAGKNTVQELPDEDSGKKRAQK